MKPGWQVFFSPARLERDWLDLGPSAPWQSSEEHEATLEALCKWANRLEAKVAELARGRNSKVNAAAVYAWLPLDPTEEDKRRAQVLFGIKRRQLNRLIEQRGKPVHVTGKFEIRRDI
jgi:hypothetical protein